jgi:hypothetical protein
MVFGSIALAGCARWAIWLRRHAGGVAASIRDQRLHDRGVRRCGYSMTNSGWPNSTG